MVSLVSVEMVFYVSLEGSESVFTMIVKQSKVKRSETNKAKVEWWW